MIVVDFDLIGTVAIGSVKVCLYYRTGQQAFKSRGWRVWILLCNDMNVAMVHRFIHGPLNPPQS